MTLGSRLLASVTIPILVAAMAIGEVQKGEPEAGTRPTSRQQLRLREKWFRKGRKLAAAPASRFLYRAQQQKLRQRAVRLKLQSTNTPVTPWIPLGPAPLNSNATGALGEQDYGA